MDCRNCGAPMRPVGEPVYFHCPYCRSYHFPPELPDGVTPLGQVQDGLSCPVCHVPLLLASVHRRYRARQCPKCRGVLLSQESFVGIVESYLARTGRTRQMPRRFTREELERVLFCPSCHRRMDTHPYLGPARFVIDLCEPCHSVWLEYGELCRFTCAPRRKPSVDIRPQAEMPVLVVHKRPGLLPDWLQALFPRARD